MVNIMSKIGFTTSRSPTNKTRTFIHDMVSVVPNSSRIPRGSANEIFCLNSMKNQGFETALIINSVKGNPNFVRLFSLTDDIEELPYAIKIRGLTLSRDYQEKRRKRKPSFSILISTLENPTEEIILRKFLGISNESIEKFKDKEYVTVYADYIDKDEGIIFIEFLDKDNKQTGPRIKLRIVQRNTKNNNIDNLDGE
jgi:rRNA maturation protein Rpf1